MNTDAIKIKYGDNQWLQGDDFVDGGFTLTESICSESQIVFGACESAVVEVEIISTAASFVGKIIEVYLGNILLGKYKVVTDERDSDGETRRLTAYDALYEINSKDVAEWYEGIDWDSVTTLKNFRDSFFSYLSIPQVQTSLPNDSMAVSKTMDATSCSGATIIQAICEINGAFGHINSNGNFQYVFLSTDAATAITADEVFDTSTEDFTAPAFDGVQIRTEEGDIGGQYPASGVTNQYIINGNFLCFGKTSTALATAAQNASTKIFNRAYIPYEAELECQNTIAIGEKVTIPTEPATFTSYVLQRKLMGVSALEEYYAAQGTPEYVEDANSSRNQTIATAQKINKLTTTLDGTISRVESIEEDYVDSTTLEETARGFTASITEINRELQQITDQLDGEVTSYEVEVEPKFEKNADNTLVLANYPAIEWTYNIYVHPDQAVLIDSNIPFLYTDDGLKQHTRDLATDFTTYHAYRFVKEDGVYGWKQIADSDFGIAMSRIATLEATSESIKQTVNQQTLTITDQGTRLTTAEGTLTTQADEIGAKVSIEGGTASTSASWSLKPEAFIVKSNGQEVLKVNGDGLSVTGSGTFSGEVSGGSININNNFIVDSEGNMTATSGLFSGDITGAKIIVGGTEQGTTDAVTSITNSTLTTTNVTAENLKVKAANIDGTLTATQINTTGLIAENIYADTISSKTLSSNTINNGDGTFKVEANGAMTASNATITGGSITIKNGNTETFKVTNTGHLKATDAEIEGSIKTSNATISGGSIVIKNGSVENFKVTNNGVLTAKSANITGGSINIQTADTTADNIIVLNNEAAGRKSSVKISPQALSYLDEYPNNDDYKLHISVNGNPEFDAPVHIESYDGEDLIGDTAIGAGYIWLGNNSVLTTESVKWSAPPVTLNSGARSATISADDAMFKNTLILRGKLTSTYPYQMLTIPMIAITTTKTTYSISYGSNSLVVGVVKDSTGKITLSYESASMTSAIIDAAYLQ